MVNSLPSSKPPLHNIFTAVPPHYDLVNRIGTLGMDKRWRRLAAQACLETKPRRILDIGCGTGDLTINIARLASKDIEIVGLDYSLPMLERARYKAEKAGVGKSIRFIEGEASHLPFPDASFDVAAISFAFRNLTYKNPVCRQHLAEVLRILKPGGRYVIVESSQPENGFIRACFHLYMRAFVKPMGLIISGNRGAYRYLSESTIKYYSPREVRDLLTSAGFREVKYRPLFFGAAGIHVAVK
jgi:demethylmenaquinone methyltransferase/2-methoxy-6-polyprenyl-1,4-benzoquinol methylase